MLSEGPRGGSPDPVVGDSAGREEMGARISWPAGPGRGGQVVWWLTVKEEEDCWRQKEG